MPFEFKKILDHGTSNPIVARLSLQSLQLLDQCDVTSELRDAVGELYVNSLQRKLLRCWEIEQRFCEGFNVAVAEFSLPGGRARSITIPQIARLEEECHNFLYEAKNYIRDLLKVFNLLYSTTFKEASEYSRSKKGKLSLINWAISTFGKDDPKTKLLLEAVTAIEMLIAARNAVEHPGGYNGTLYIQNFTLERDGRLCEPVWYREKNGNKVHAPSSIRMDMPASIHNLLVLGEDVLASWAADHLTVPKFIRVAVIPAKQRDPQCPVKYIVTATPELQEKLASAHRKE